MVMPDALALADQLLHLGLVTEAQLDEAWEAIGRDTTDAEALVRALERKEHLTSWQIAKLLKGEKDGFIVGGFRILYQVASGSFGRVYRAIDPHTHQGVAIKVLRKRWCRDRQRVEMFQREGKLVQSLDHPNIVRTAMVNTDPATGHYYLVMDFIEGGNLRDFLGIRKKLNPAEALRLIEDAAQGLAYAHSRNVGHRDIKLTNILIASEGRALLVDFGLAELGHEKNGKVERTIDYAALEKVTGAKAGDLRSDIFFLGCVLYEMLTGRSPLVTARDRTTRQQMQRFDNLPPMEKEEVEGPPSLFHLVQTMMAFNPQSRYQNAPQLLDAIRAVRREIEGKGPCPHDTVRSVFVAEGDVRLQDAIRDKFRELGYRVLMAADPNLALDRFRQQPFDALVLDAGTTGEEGVRIFDRILFEADRRKVDCAGILILQPNQADWAKRLPPRKSSAVMIRPVTLKQLHRKLQALVPLPAPKKEGKA